MDTTRNGSNWTGRTPRTSREAFGLSPDEARGYEFHRAPITRRFLYAWMKWGWVLVLLAVLLLTGCADEAQTWAADQAALADAINQAAKEVAK